jgi:NAD+ synthase
MRTIDIKGTYYATVDWTKKFIVGSGCSGAVVGLSGGIDSALAAAVCVDAIGKNNVYGLILPCKSNPDDQRDAIDVIKLLQIDAEVIDLTAALNTLNETIEEPNAKIANANLRSRLRMCALYYRANQKGYLVCGTTNLTEMFIGYYTKYGDGGIDFEPLASLFKSEVRLLAKDRGIPDKIIEKAPSAGLWTGQTDETELGMTYDRMDAAIWRLQNAEVDLKTDNDARKMRDMHQNSVHKRIVPPACQQVVLI